eukprot:10034216-Alexandrium_andersonii.AAC.1
MINDFDPAPPEGTCRRCEAAINGVQLLVADAAQMYEDLDPLLMLKALRAMLDRAKQEAIAEW